MSTATNTAPSATTAAEFMRACWARDALMVRVEQLSALLCAITDLSTNTPRAAATVESLQYLAHRLAEELPQAIGDALDEAAADAVQRAALKEGGAA